MLNLGKPRASLLARMFSGVGLACAALFATTASAYVYSEAGDAGATPGTAQTTIGAVPLTDIVGTLHTDGDEVDMYLINITSPGTFSATTVNTGGDPLDTQLFLFTLAGAPVFMNDDADGTTIQSTLPAGHSAGPVAPGLYLLAVAFAGYDPINSVSQLLFASGLTTDVRGPAVSLQPAELSEFTGTPLFPDRGGYDIQLTGARSAIPEPSALLLGALALGLCGLARRRTVR